MRCWSFTIRLLPSEILEKSFLAATRYGVEVIFQSSAIHNRALYSNRVREPLWSTRPEKVSWGAFLLLGRGVVRHDHCLHRTDHAYGAVASKVVLIGRLYRFPLPPGKHSARAAKAVHFPKPGRDAVPTGERRASRDGDSPLRSAVIDYGTTLPFGSLRRRFYFSIAPMCRLAEDTTGVGTVLGTVAQSI